MDRAELPRIVVDFESLRMLNCGLGRFAMHLGEALLRENPPDFRFNLLLPDSGKPNFPAELPEYRLVIAGRKASDYARHRIHYARYQSTGN